MGSLPGRVPLVVGTTGHRDLRAQDVPALEREVRAVFNRLRRDYAGDDNETPLILVSALAEGADSLVARVGLSMGIELIAPLPLPVAEYRRDFEQGLAPNAAGEFDKLLAQAAASPTMAFTAGNSLEAVRTDAAKRAEQYRAVGLFIVQHCDVLVALWDGSEKDKAMGGSGEVVTFKREGIPLFASDSAHASLDGSEIGPVIHIVTPRKKAGSPASSVAVRAWGEELLNRHRGNLVQKMFARFGKFGASLLGREQNSVISTLPLADRRDLEAWLTFDTLITLTREFNGEAATLAATTDNSQQTTASTDNLFADPDDGRIDDDARSRAIAVAPHWCRLFGIADTLAQGRQAQFRGDWTWMFVFSFVAFVFFALSSHMEQFADFLLVGYAFFVAIVLFLFVRARIRRDQERFLDYRALAEALRVAVYWNILGIDSHRPGRKESVAEASTADSGALDNLVNSYPIKQPSELAWIKICLRTLDLGHRPDGASARHGIDSEAHAIARRFWVYGQLSYFQRQGTRHNRRAEFLESWSFVFLFITSLFLLQLLLTAFGPGPHLGPKWHKVFLVATGLLPGFAATLTGYSERLALAAQARQYDRMRMLFQRAFELLPEVFDESAEHRIRALYRELGIEAMKESADWFAIYRQRPIRPVQ